MFASARLNFDPTVLVDHVSPHGRVATDVRGMLIQSRLRKLREHGYYDDYIARLPDPHRETLVHALAASWVPVEASVAHFETLDSMMLSDAQIAHMSEPMGASFFESIFGGILRSIRNAGADAGAWIALKQADRVYGRMYQGGGVRVSQVGPKDALIEVSGLAFAHSRGFRVSHSAFVRGVVSLSTKSCFCRAQQPAGAPSDSFTLALSWV